MLPNADASVQPVVCCFLLTVGATATRLVGLYICLTPAILSLLESRGWEEGKELEPLHLGAQ